MRLIGAFAIFVLAVATIVNAAYLFKLSRRMDTLAASLRADPPKDESAVPGAKSGRTAGDREPIPIVRTATWQPTQPQPLPVVLDAALQSPEGRQHLKEALAALEEQAHQERLTERVAGEDHRDQRNRERLARLVSLSPEEQYRLAEVHTAAQAERRRIIEEMMAGQKNADQAEEALDSSRATASQRVRAVIGDQRLKELRELQSPQSRIVRQHLADGSTVQPPP